MDNDNVDAARALLKAVSDEHDETNATIGEHTVVATAQVLATLALVDAARDLNDNITDLRSDIRDGYTSR